MAEVLRVAPNENIGGVTWGMEDLVTAAASAGTIQAALAALPGAYAAWIDPQEVGIADIDGVPAKPPRMICRHACGKRNIVSALGLSCWLRMPVPARPSQR